MAKKRGKSTSGLVLKLTGSMLQIFLNIIFYSVLIIAVARFSVEAYTIGYQIFGSVAVDEEPGHEVELEITEDESLLNLAKRLEVSKLIENKYSFYLKAKLNNRVIIPGKYTLYSSMNYDEILEAVTAAGDK